MKRELTTLLLALIAIFSINTKAAAQEYNSAVGVTLGGAVSIDYKQFISYSGALEVSLAYELECNAPLLVAVYQHHIELADQLNLYIGGGFDIGAIHAGNHSDTEFALGLTPNIGFEYKLPNAPVAIGLDYKPAINLTCHSLWRMGGLKLRYTF